MAKAKKSVVLKFIVTYKMRNFSWSSYASKVQVYDRRTKKLLYSTAK